MNLVNFKRKSILIAGTSLFGALIFVLDWTFKLSGLKIPFPLFPNLKFDPLGIPIFLSFFLFGIFSGFTTSIIAMTSIAFRDPFSGFMKFLAEFTTLLGVYLVFKIQKTQNNRLKILAAGSGILIRVLIMSVANLILLPIFLPTLTFEAVVVILPLIGLFNAIQGVISIFGGFIFYEALSLRIRPREKQEFGNKK